MNNQELQKLSDQVEKKDFPNVQKINTTFDSRLRTTGARFHLVTYYRVTNVSIQVNPKMYKLLGVKGIIKALKHEFIHYYLWSCDMPDGHNAYFRALARHFHCPVYLHVDLEPNKTCYIYQCTNCNRPFVTLKHYNLNNYVCSSCSHSLKLVGTTTHEKLEHHSSKTLNNAVRAYKQSKQHQMA